MSSTITIPSRCHAYPNEWDGEQNAGIPYAFNDRIEILTWREIEEVERSGRSDHRSYAETPTQWPGEQHPVAPLMEARPGKTGTWRVFPGGLGALRMRRARRFDSPARYKER